MFIPRFANFRGLPDSPSRPKLFWIGARFKAEYAQGPRRPRPNKRHVADMRAFLAVAKVPSDPYGAAPPGGRMGSTTCGWRPVSDLRKATILSVSSAPSF